MATHDSAPLTPEDRDGNPRAGIACSCIVTRETRGAVTVQVMRGDVVIKARQFGLDAVTATRLEVDGFDTTLADFGPVVYTMRVVGDRSEVAVSGETIGQVACAVLEAELLKRRAKRMARRLASRRMA